MKKSQFKVQLRFNLGMEVQFDPETDQLQICQVDIQNTSSNVIDVTDVENKFKERCMRKEIKIKGFDMEIPIEVMKEGNNKVSLSIKNCSNEIDYNFPQIRKQNFVNAQQNDSMVLDVQRMDQKHKELNENRIIDSGLKIKIPRYVVKENSNTDPCVSLDCNDLLVKRNKVIESDREKEEVSLEKVKFLKGHSGIKEFSSKFVDEDKNYDINTPDAITGFKTLNDFFINYYLEDKLNLESLNSMNSQELIILLKLFGVENNKERSALMNNNIILKQFVFNKLGDLMYKEEFIKCPNGRRFIYGKIKNIIYKKFKNSLSNKKLKKKEIDRKFFKFYFYSSEEYKKIPMLSRLNVEKVFNSFEQNNVKLLLCFPAFKQEFKRVYLNFEHELKESYYRPKCRILKDYFLTLIGKSAKALEEAVVPFLKLPHSHSTVRIYYSDFGSYFQDAIIQ